MLSHNSLLRGSKEAIEEKKGAKKTTLFPHFSNLFSRRDVSDVSKTVCHGRISNEEPVMWFTPIPARPNTNQISPGFQDTGKILNGVEFSQTIVVDSSDVGYDGFMTLPSLQRKFQDAALLHAEKVGVLFDGLGRTEYMQKSQLIWAIIRFKIQIHYYPVEKDKLVIQTVVWSDKLGMRRDWIIIDPAKHLLYAKATSRLVIMNMEERTVSKMPVEVNKEIEPFYSEKRAFKDPGFEKCGDIDDKVNFVKSGLGVKFEDIDMNGHVNNSKYPDWIFEAIPKEVLERCVLSCITMEFKNECLESDKIQSLCSLDEVKIKNMEIEGDMVHKLLMDQGSINLKHRIDAIREGQSVIVMKAMTIWKKKCTSIHP